MKTQVGEPKCPKCGAHHVVAPGSGAAAAKPAVEEPAEKPTPAAQDDDEALIAKMMAEEAGDDEILAQLLAEEALEKENAAKKLAEEEAEAKRISEEAVQAALGSDSGTKKPGKLNMANPFMANLGKNLAKERLEQKMTDNELDSAKKIIKQFRKATYNN